MAPRSRPANLLLPLGRFVAYRKGAAGPQPLGRYFDGPGGKSID
jgi:hypothetical protein